jgi:hypothetical protein
MYMQTGLFISSELTSSSELAIMSDVKKRACALLRICNRRNRYRKGTLSADDPLLLLHRRSFRIQRKTALRERQVNHMNQVRPTACSAAMQP